MSATSVPVFILGGFLGSGKTSTLNHILRNSQSSRLGVIVNDFGELPIDSYLIDSQVDNQIQLSNGCICCEVQDGDLVEALEGYIKGDSNLDAILIESSGLADPGVIANTVRYANIKGVRYGGIVYTIDSLNFFDVMKEHSDTDKHLKAADIILLNKTDLASGEQIEKIKDYIKSLEAKALIIPTTRGSIDPSILLDLKSEPESDQLSILDALREVVESDSHAHHKFTSISFKTSQPLNPKVFAETMRTKFVGVYRIKGIAYFGMKGMEQKYIFQSVRGSYELEIDEWQDNEEVRSEIVAIGTDIDEAKLNSAFKATIDTRPDNAKSDEMVDVRRLLQNRS